MDDSDEDGADTLGPVGDDAGDEGGVGDIFASAGGGTGNVIRRDSTPEGVPANANRVEDAGDCTGNVVEGPQGGTYCIPEGTDPVASTPEDAQQEVATIADEHSGAELRNELSSYMSDATGVDDVSLDGMDDETATSVAQAAATLGAAGETDGITAINTEPDAGMEERGSAGNYDPFSREVRLDPEKITSEQASEWGESGFLANGTVEHIVAHEIGHHRHFQNEVGGQSAGMEAQTQEIPEDAREAFAEQVSVYGAKNPNELVAELYAKQAAGEELSTGEQNAYDTFNGPEVAL